MPRLLELFSGTGSVGSVFASRGWDVESVDLDPKSGATYVCDVRDFPYKDVGSYDVIWASPPCTEYSRARTTAKKPRNYELADSLAQATLDIIQFHILQVHLHVSVVCLIVP